MNRRKKAKQIILKKAKKANEKKAPKNKPRYISKAERAELEAQEQPENSTEVESGSEDSAQ